MASCFMRNYLKAYIKFVISLVALLVFSIVCCHFNSEYSRIYNGIGMDRII